MLAAQDGVQHKVVNPSIVLTSDETGHGKLCRVRDKVFPLSVRHPDLADSDFRSPRKLFAANICWLLWRYGAI